MFGVPIQNNFYNLTQFKHRTRVTITFPSLSWSQCHHDYHVTFVLSIIRVSVKGFRMLHIPTVLLTHFRGLYCGYLTEGESPIIYSVLGDCYIDTALRSERPPLKQYSSLCFLLTLSRPRFVYHFLDWDDDINITLTFDDLKDVWYKPHIYSVCFSVWNAVIR